MIYIQPQPEPNNFDIAIRQKGNTWLNDNPNYRQQEKKLPTYWTACLDDLYQAYHGICAYYAWYIDKASGGCSVDHFNPKSPKDNNQNYDNQIYEWCNFRLACLDANRKKNNYEDVLDPFLPYIDNVFTLDLTNGRINISSQGSISTILKQLAETTIERLKLNAPNNCQKRAEDFTAYIHKHIDEQYLKTKVNPFVWREAHRQGLL